MVRLYTKSNCQPCRMSKLKLESLGIPFEELSVEADEANLAAVKELGFLAVPVLVLEDGSAVSGYRPDVITGLKEEVAA